MLPKHMLLSTTCYSNKALLPLPVTIKCFNARIR